MRLLLRFPDGNERIAGELFVLPEEFKPVYDLGRWGVFRVEEERRGVFTAVCNLAERKPPVQANRPRTAPMALNIPGQPERIIDLLNITIHEGMIYECGELVGGLRDISLLFVPCRSMPISMLPKHAVEAVKAKIRGLGLVVGTDGRMRLGGAGTPAEGASR